MGKRGIGVVGFPSTIGRNASRLPKLERHKEMQRWDRDPEP